LGFGRIIIKWILKKQGGRIKDWILPAQDKANNGLLQTRSYIFQFCKWQKNFLTSCMTTSFSRKLLFYGVMSGKLVGYNRRRRSRQVEELPLHSKTGEMDIPSSQTNP
jgi:hypothetical protein